MHQYIRELPEYEGQSIYLKGWVANTRQSKGLVFLILRDGTGFSQCVIAEDDVAGKIFETARSLSQECAVEVWGEVVRDERQIGGFEVQVEDLDVISKPVDDFPVSNKEHGIKFLTDNRHLWLRSRRPWAVLRVRNAIIMAIHRFFQDRGFIQFDAPIFTSNAAEGSTDLFHTDFFGEPAYLSQTGQLQAEAGAMSHNLVYTFGPTFRAERSDTPRHLSEFWMIEPEMAFYDLQMNMDLIEDFVRNVVLDVISRMKFELEEILERDLGELKKVEKPFPRITYEEAVLILRGEKVWNGKNAIEIQKQELSNARERITDLKDEISEREETLSGQIKKGVRKYNEQKIAAARKEMAVLKDSVENIPLWIRSAESFEPGQDFGNSDETVLTKVFDAPVMIYNWPAAIKAFYMKRVEGNNSYVKGVDLLAPDGYGEIVGGSEREEDLEQLLAHIKEQDIPTEELEWYLDLRRYGTVPHSGFGLGLERVVRWICGLHHLRETIPFPRRYGRLRP